MGKGRGRGGWGGEEEKREVKKGDKFETCAPDVRPFIWSRPIRLTPSYSLPPPPPSFLLGCTAEDSHLDLKCSKCVARRSGGGEGEGVGRKHTESEVRKEGILGDQREKDEESRRRFEVVEGRLAGGGER